MDLVKITYYRYDDIENTESAVLTQHQVDEVERLIPYITIVSKEAAPEGSKPNYSL